MWLTVNLKDATEAKKCVPAEEKSDVVCQIIANTNAGELSRQFSASAHKTEQSSGDPGIDAKHWELSQLLLDWRIIQRVRMPNSSQAWSLARAKWEKKTSEGSGCDTTTMVKTASVSSLVEWSFIELITPENIDKGDAIATDCAIKLHMLAVCPVSKVTQSVVRYHDANGLLKSVAFLSGSLSS
jgi:hypothetical protein